MPVPPYRRFRERSRPGESTRTLAGARSVANGSTFTLAGPLAEVRVVKNQRHKYSYPAPCESVSCPRSRRKEKSCGELSGGALGSWRLLQAVSLTLCFAQPIELPSVSRTSASTSRDPPERGRASTPR